MNKGSPVGGADIISSRVQPRSPLMIEDYHHLNKFHHPITSSHKTVRSLLSCPPVELTDNSNIFMQVYSPLIFALECVSRRREILSYSVAKHLRIQDPVTMEIINKCTLKN